MVHNVLFFIFFFFNFSSVLSFQMAYRNRQPRFFPVRRPLGTRKSHVFDDRYLKNLTVSQYQQRPDTARSYRRSRSPKRHHAPSTHTSGRRQRLSPAPETYQHRHRRQKRKRTRSPSPASSGTCSTSSVISGDGRSGSRCASPSKVPDRDNDPFINCTVIPSTQTTQQLVANKATPTASPTGDKEQVASTHTSPSKSHLPTKKKHTQTRSRTPYIRVCPVCNRTSL